MTIANQVRALIERLSPAPVCDACIADRLDLETPQLADREASELAGRQDFERQMGICSICARAKKVIRFRRR
jgi:hypothetical protein